MKTLISFALCLFLSAAAFSFPSNPDSTNISDSEVSDSSGLSKEIIKMLDVLSSLQYKTGEVEIGKGIAKVTVPEGFQFLEAKDAQAVLSGVWGNPPDADILGLLVPDSIKIFDPSSWAVTYSYLEDGHVKDDDAADTDYDELLGKMKEETDAANEERAKQGYEKVKLIGWAQQPFYDKATHKLHWAKEANFEGDSVNTLNYNIRMLGRKGVLVMNVISGMDNFGHVKSKMNDVLTSTNFTKGNRYEDFDSSVDKIAEYGIGALVAGAVLAKTGLLAKLGLILIKGWKIIALAVVGAGAFLKKKFFGKKDQNPTEGNPQ
jgi:uncharacterized membrane-anchored protein